MNGDFLILNSPSSILSSNSLFSIPYSRLSDILSDVARTKMHQNASFCTTFSIFLPPLRQIDAICDLVSARAANGWRLKPPPRLSSPLAPFPKLLAHHSLLRGAASIDRRMPIRTIPKHTDGINNYFGKIRKELGCLYLDRFERVEEVVVTG